MKNVYENKWFKIVQEGNYFYLDENNQNGAIILPIINNHFIFVKVYRIAHKTTLIEAPRGNGETGETGALTAARELFEETGYHFQSSDMKLLGHVHPNSSILSSKTPVFLAEAKEAKVTGKIDTEISSVIHIKKTAIFEEIRMGRINDGMTLSALALYWANQKYP